MSTAAAKSNTPPAGPRDVASLPLQLREAQIVPASFDAENNTVDVVWTTGARRTAYDRYNDQVYEEELAVEPDAVDMSRFESGVIQVLDNHSTYGGTGAILGVALRGSIENGQGLATIKLSTDPNKSGVISDIRAGVIRALSFGYSVQKYQVTPANGRDDGGSVPLYRAVQWTPYEISFVNVPADPNATTRATREPALTRSQPLHGHPCEFIRADAAHSSTEEITMPTEAELAQRAAEDKAAREKAVSEAATAERQRAADVTALCTRHSVPADKMNKFITDGTSVEAVRTQILNEIAERDAGAGQRGANVVRVHTISDETKTRMDGMQEAFMHRAGALAPDKLTDNGRQYRGMSLLEIGREHLERSGFSTRGMDRMTLATNIMQFRSGGMMGTSDFGSLLANVANKRLRQAYEENMPSYQRWARKAPDAPDFKSMTVVNLGSTPDLLQVNEHGEFKYASMSDGKETYGLLTYGRIVAFTRQALINDDLRGFDRLVGGFGNSAARLENRTVYGILTANAALSDTVALFEANTHKNLAGSGGAIAIATLTTGRAAMRLQKGLQSEELNIAPRFLLAPATQEQVAYQYTSANYVPTQQSNVNEFRVGGRTALEVVVDAVLDGNSTTAWYLAADPAQIDTVEYCWLEGAAGPVVESEVGFDVDGLKLKGRLDFAAKALDFRGLYKNPGA